MKRSLAKALGFFLLIATGSFWGGFWWYLGQDMARVLVILLVEAAHR